MHACVCVHVSACIWERERAKGSLEVIRKVAPFTMENWLLFWHYPYPHPPTSHPPPSSFVVWIAGVNNQIWAWVYRATLLISLMPPSENFLSDSFLVIDRNLARFRFRLKLRPKFQFRFRFWQNLEFRFQSEFRFKNEPNFDRFFKTQDRLFFVF